MKPISVSALSDVLKSLMTKMTNTMDTKMKIITDGIFVPTSGTPTNTDVKFFSNNGKYESVESSYRTMTDTEISTTISTILNQ